MLKLWKCTYVLNPDYGSSSKVIDYMWSENYPEVVGNYWLHLFDCCVVFISCEEVIPYEGMIINTKITDINEVEE